MGQRITVCINTKSRPDFLLVTLSSLLAQTYQDWDLIICDASSEPVINLEPIEKLLRIFKKYGHNVRYEVDNNLGIPQTYEKMRQLAETELVIRQEDDIWMEPECIERAYEVLDPLSFSNIVKLSEWPNAKDIGAVAFMTPHYLVQSIVSAPEKLNNAFYKVEGHELVPNLPYALEPRDEQALLTTDDVVWEVCHLHGGSLFKQEAAEAVGGFCTHLSPVGHREETLFYARMFFAGWKLCVRSTARLWHFEATSGGSRPSGDRDPNRKACQCSDEGKFQAELQELMKANPDRQLTLA